LVKCPCCGYDTLTEEGGFEICLLCSWEDEGLGRIMHADIVIGGANADYSLTEARENYKKYLTMYRPNQHGFSKSQNPHILSHKRKMMEFLNEIETTNSDEERERLKMEYEEIRMSLRRLKYVY